MQEHECNARITFLVRLFYFIFFFSHQNVKILPLVNATVIAVIVYNVMQRIQVICIFNPPVDYSFLLLLRGYYMATVAYRPGSSVLARTCVHLSICILPMNVLNHEIANFSKIEFFFY